MPEQPVVESAPKTSTPEKDSNDADTLLSGDLISDVKPIVEKEKPLIVENEKTTTEKTVAKVPTPSFEVHPPIVESFHIPSITIDLPPPTVHTPVQELNTHPFLPPKPILIIEPNQLPLNHDENIPVVVVTPSPPAQTTVTAEIVEITQKTTDKTTEIPTTTTEVPISDEKSTTTAQPTSVITEKPSTQAPTTPENVVSTTVVQTTIPASTTTTRKPEIEETTTEKVKPDPTETIPKSEFTRTEKSNKEIIEPIIIQDLVPPSSEAPISLLDIVVDKFIENTLPLVQHPIVNPANEEVPANAQVTSSTTESSVDLAASTTVIPPRPKAFIRSIQSDLIKQISPSAQQFLNSKETVISDINDMLYKFNYTAGFHGHMEQGDMAGSKNGEYFIVGRDNIKRTVKYTASKHGFVPSIRFGPVNDEIAPKPETEKEFGMRGYEFEWYSQKLPKSPENSIIDE